MNTSVNEQSIKISVGHQKKFSCHKPALFFIEYAIKCLKKAIEINPQERYLKRLKEFYGLKNEEYSEESPFKL